MMTTKPLPRFWKSLDEIPDATTDRREWIIRLGDEWPYASRYLTATGKLAAAIDCPSPGGEGCPRRIVRHADGRFRAVCGNRPAECDSLDLTRQDIGCLAFDRKKLGRVVGALLGATPGSGPEERGAAVCLGSHAVAAGIGIPVFLLIPSPMTQGSFPEPLDLDGPAAIVTPTPVSIPGEDKAALKSRGHIVLALSEIAVADGQHRLTGLQSAEQLLSPLREKLLARQAPTGSGRIWILPAEARWEDLTFEFIADEVVNVRFGQQTRRFEPEHFGMKSVKNGKPTGAWTVLRVMAGQAGQLGWSDKAASRRVKKQKQLLSGLLRRAFGISTDPIRWHRLEACYRTRFVVRASMPSERHRQRR
jgi:hypothetical protein